MMIPVDHSVPSEYVGVDYTAYFRGPVIYDGAAVSGLVMDIIEEYLTENDLSCRRCFYPGRGAAAGGPAFLEVFLWVQEHWEFLAGAASVVLARLAKMRDRWRRLKRMWGERVLDPYQPTVIVELAARTQGDGDQGRLEEELSFRSLVSRVPDISERLRRKLPEQKFTFRVLTLGSSAANSFASFRVSEVKQSDATKMVRYLETHDVHTSHSAVLLYRKFGFLTMIKTTESSGLLGPMLR